MHLLPRGLLILLLLSLAGCGFQPRGSSGLPEDMAVTYIQGAQPWTEIHQDFRDALEDRGVTVTEERSEATAVLRILKQEFRSDLLTVDIGGRVQELQYVQMIRFQVEARDQQVLVPEQAVTARRDFVFNKTEILAKERESQFVRQALQRDVVNLAMLRIMVAGRDAP